MNVHSNTLDFCVIWFILYLVTWLASVSKYRNIFLSHKKGNNEEISALYLDNKKNSLANLTATLLRNSGLEFWLMKQSDTNHFYFELICKCVVIGALLYLKTVNVWSCKTWYAMRLLCAMCDSHMTPFEALTMVSKNWILT
jgi:hypothetical protein